MNTNNISTRYNIDTIIIAQVIELHDDPKLTSKRKKELQGIDGDGYILFTNWKAVLRPTRVLLGNFPKIDLLISSESILFDRCTRANLIGAPILGKDLILYLKKNDNTIQHYTVEEAIGLDKITRILLDQRPE